MIAMTTIVSTWLPLDRDPLLEAVHSLKSLTRIMNRAPSSKRCSSVPITKRVRAL